ncbi:acylneuraminate cytidylyltransferase family protein [Paenibacillus aquistagni]|uniref:CMP-N,N'-diacetyllegionaminic acid synthase n=1 Tax=Paenibacillus aquistagni TaxID=1852522 RepID=A0A1X7KZJ6_9BACL|nr:acylneuraminate cytidylyltransferase family protein [Paenibacillus aquistagni]SMG46299.1 CMP-N,N'-diacetyllegionaminic acid synthase [Paenibacillus aquistagni]
MNILITVCGRRGSKGVKNKIVRTMNGYPLALYTFSIIDLLKKKSTDHIDVAVNTDSHELAQFSKVIQESIIVERDESLTGDYVSKFDVIKDTYVRVKELTAINYDMVVDLDITSPLRTLIDLQNVIEAKQNDSEMDVIFTVVKSRRSPYFNMVEEDGGSVRLINKSRYTARQQTPQSFDMNASIYAYSPYFLEHTNYLFDGKCGIVEMKDTLVLDIDSEEDFEWVEYIHKKIIEEDQGHKDIYSNINVMLHRNISLESGG